MRLHRCAITLLALTALLTAAGCSSDPLTPASTGGGFSAQMADVALQSDAIVDAILESEMSQPMPSVAAMGGEGGSGVVTDDISFSRSRSCPLGGMLEVQGNLHREVNRDTGEMDAEFIGSRTRTDCSFARNEFTFIVNGQANIEAERHRVNGTPVGLQTAHYFGSFEGERSDGEVRSCAYDVSVVRDPDSRTRTVEGTICGDPVSRTTTWN